VHLQERYQTAAVSLDAAGDFKFKKHHTHHARRSLGEANQIVDQNRRRPKQGNDPAAFVGGRVNARERFLGDRLRLSRRLVQAHDRLQHGNDIGRFGHRRRALLDQAVGSFRARIERRAWNREDFPSLLERQARGDQR